MFLEELFRCFVAITTWCTSGNRTKKEHSQSLSSFWTLVNQWSPFCASGVGIMSALCPPWTETENAETSSYSERNNQIKSPEGAIVVGQGLLWVFWSLGIQHRSSKWPLWCFWKKILTQMMIDWRASDPFLFCVRQWLDRAQAPLRKKTFKSDALRQS